MIKIVKDLCRIEYGASPMQIRSDDNTGICIYGTGGFVGYSKEPLFKEPLIVVARKGTLDKPLLADLPCWVIDTAYAAIPKNDVDVKWLYYQFQMFDLSRLNESTGVPSISRSYLYKQPIPYQAQPEQRKIATILSTVDKVIENTEAAIEKYKAIKAGMMQDLFNRGIDVKTGKLRPSYKEAPKLYKETELGWIPKEWRVAQLTEFSNGGLKNGYFKKPDYVGRGYKLINVSDLYQPFGIDINHKDVERVFATKRDYAKYEVQVGDIFYTRSSLVLEGIAHCNILLNIAEETVWECHVVRLRPNKQVIDPIYLGYYCTTHAARLFFMSIAKQVTMTTISQPDIAKLKVPHPTDINEQTEISRRLLSLDENLRNEKRELIKYLKLKNGLMADLLTGIIRVKNEK